MSHLRAFRERLVELRRSYPSWCLRIAVLSIAGFVAVDLMLPRTAHAQSEAAASMSQAAARSCAANPQTADTSSPSVRFIRGTPGSPLCQFTAAGASFDSAAPIQFAVFNTLAIQSGQQFQAIVRERIETLQENKPGDIALHHATSLPGLAGAPYKTGGAASADQDNGGRLGTFFTVEGSKGDQSATSRQDGFDGHTLNLVGGVDYRFSPSLVIGGAVGYQKGKTAFNFDRGSIDLDSYLVSAFFNWSADKGWYLDGIVSHAFNRYDTTRRFVDPAGDRQTTTASPNGRRSTATATIGYNLFRGPYAFAPFVSINYINQHISAFSESGAIDTDFAVGGQSQNSLTGGLGLQGSRPISTSWGVLSLGARAEWKHEFRNDSLVLPMSFSVDPANGAFQVPTDAPDRSYFLVGVSAAAQFARGRSAFIQYDTVLGLRDVSNHILSAGVRLEF